MRYCSGEQPKECWVFMEYLAMRYTKCAKSYHEAVDNLSNCVKTFFRKKLSAKKGKKARPLSQKSDDLAKEKEVVTEGGKFLPKKSAFSTAFQVLSHVSPHLW